MFNQKSKSKMFPTTSSDAVIWEGQDLACIKLCTGDTVSDVVYKVAMNICAILDAYNLDDLDLKCVFEACQACPAPDKSIQNVLSLIINKICSIDTIIKTLSTGTGTTDEKIITLASCFLPRTDSDGDPITKLPHSDYTRLIASTVCNIVSTVDGLSTRMGIAEEDIAEILTELNTIGDLPKVSPTCVTPTNTPIAIDVAFQKLEQQFCQLRTVSGMPADLAQSMSKQPSGLKDENQLGGNGTMSGMTDWRTDVSTVADSISNMWQTIVDMRGAVKAIQDNCCKVNCDSVLVDFDIKLDDTRTQLTLFFAAKSKIPVGFKDCNNYGNLLTVSDSNGASVEFRIKIADVAKYTTSGDTVSDLGVLLDLSATPLDANLDYTFNMEACMTNGDMTCQKCLEKTATYKDTCSYCEITASANHSGDINGELVIIYEN